MTLKRFGSLSKMYQSKACRSIGRNNGTSQRPKYNGLSFYLDHVIEQPIFRIPILFVYFFIDFFVKHIFFEAHLERVIDGAADCLSYF